MGGGEKQLDPGGGGGELVGPLCSCLSDGGPVVKARVLTCVEGMNLALLERAISEQRAYQRERDSRP